MIEQSENMNDRYLLKLHEEILTVMDEIHRVCQQHSLQYYLIGGTLLGAIRHGGFIPWDDDLDIVMPREDFERFVAHSDSWLSDNYELEWITTNPQYPYIFAKVTKKGTLFLDSAETKQMGIFIDIFPIDSSGPCGRVQKIRKFVIKHLNSLTWHKLVRDCFPRYWYMWLPSRLLTFHMVHRLVRWVAVGAGDRDVAYYANFGSQYSIIKQTIPQTWYGEGVVAKFEDREYIIPKQSEKVLSSIFGAHYMDLPPVEKRRSHYPAMVVFSDGEVMEFQYEHKVTVEEQES